jgi:hypothetical protein
MYTKEQAEKKFQINRDYSPVAIRKVRSGFAIYLF